MSPFSSRAAAVLVLLLAVTQAGARDGAVREGPFPEPLVARAPVAEPPVAEPPVAEPPVAEPRVAEPPVAEPPVAEPPVAEPSVAEPSVAEPPVAEPAVGEPPAARPSSVQPPAAGAPVAQPPAAEPPVAEPAIAERAVAQPPPAERPAPSRPAPTVRSRPARFGRWSLALGTMIEERGPGFTMSFAVGFAPVERLRVDVRGWLGGPYHDSFSTAGMLLGGGAHPADSPVGDLKVMRGGLEVAVALRRGRLEPRVAVGWAMASVEAETTYTVDAVFLGRWQNTASDGGDAAGPCVAAGVDVAVGERALLGLEVRKPFLAPARLRGEIPLDVEVGSVLASLTFTLRWGR